MIVRTEKGRKRERECVKENVRCVRREREMSASEVRLLRDSVCVAGCFRRGTEKRRRGDEREEEKEEERKAAG